MSIPDYFITHTLVTEQMQRQFREAGPEGLPEPRPARPRPSRVAAVRHQLSVALYRLASQLEPPTAATGPRA